MLNAGYPYCPECGSTPPPGVEHHGLCRPCAHQGHWSRLVSDEADAWRRTSHWAVYYTDNRFSPTQQAALLARFRRVPWRGAAPQRTEAPMSDYHVRLALDYLQARPTAERTMATLRDIVTHVATTYALPATEEVATQQDALAEARRRGLLPLPAS